MHQFNLGRVLSPGLVDYHQKAYQPVGRPLVPTFERSVARGAALGRVRARGVTSNKFRAILGTSPSALFSSISTDFVFTTCSHHAVASPPGDQSCATPVAELRQTRTGNVKVNSRSREHIACWNMRTILDTVSQFIFMCTFFDYGIDIACPSEVCLPNFGNRCI